MLGGMIAHSQNPSAGMVDRPVFWAELGLVSAPALLVRIGSLLQEFSARDEELSKAMDLAARHVQQECLVWTPYIAASQHDAAVQEGAPLTSPRNSNTNLGVTSEGTLLELEPVKAEDLWSVDSFSRTSSDCSGDDQRSPRSPRLSPSHCEICRLFPQHSLVMLLPGMSQGLCHVLWNVMLTIGTLFATCKAIFQEVQACIHVGWGTALRKLTDENNLWVALGALSSLPLLFVMARLHRSKALNQALLAELDSSSGDEIQRFVVKAAGISALVFVVHLPRFLPLRGDGWTMILDLMTMLVMGFVHFAWSMIFLLIWKLSSNGVRRLRDRTLLVAFSRGGWSTLMNEYQEFCQLLYGLWTESGVSLLVCICLAYRSVLLFWVLVLEIAVPRSSSYVAWHLYVSICDAVMFCLMLYLMARISSSINSNNHSQKSLLMAALNCFGKDLHPKEAIDHLRFVHCVRVTMCGIEIPLLGKVTMAKVVPLLRITMAAVPACFGMALKLTREHND
mmetsp:Transcript_120832/g.353005  ORF Transcript_120832/g.353005 Transcript_120832/m.353005 type:complete len:507 (-) Transcript_120832:50-1570(-)